MRPPATATPPARAGPPRPSRTTALSITRSCICLQWGPRMAPPPPNARSSPAKPWRSSTSASAVHDQTAVDAQRLAGHVGGPARAEEGDHVGHVVRLLHAPQRHLLLALARELLRCLPEQLALVAGDQRPHVGLDEARAHAVHAHAVGGMGERQALRR